MAPNVSISVFKGFLSRKITSELYIDEEIQLLIDVFTKNGHERSVTKQFSGSKQIGMYVHLDLFWGN